MNYTKLSRRFFASLFDNIIVTGIVSILLFILKFFNMGISYKDILVGDFSPILKYNLLYCLVYLAYEVTFLTSNLSSTPGKIILEMEVVSQNPCFAKVLIRSLVKVIDTLPIIVIISGIVAAFSDKKQSIHDLVAGTYVTNYSNKNQSISNSMDSQAFHEEMKKRGIKTYSQQQALLQELYGKSSKFSGNSLLKSPILWLLVLIISLGIGIVYSNSMSAEIRSFLSFM